ncbi:MAG TPA: hypothetical protein VFX85_03140 [Solirubrobacterales bacterium]|nr:hypothetical protein [Solirubrobacterales bacterium]
MRRQLIWAIAAVASLAMAGVGAAIAAEPPTVVRVGNMVLRLNGGVTPKALPKRELAPMGFHASGSLETTDGSHPPALKQAVFDTDRDIVVGVEGLPACRPSALVARDTEHAEAACARAVLGKGSATVQVSFPEQAPIRSTGPLVLFNGGERGGAITLFAHAYVNVPAPTAVVATVRITRQSKGPYGTRIEVEVPRIAGGAGSVVAGHISARRVYTHRGERRSLLSGRCADGRFLARGSFRYRDGTVLTGSLVRTCEVAG